MAVATFSGIASGIDTQSLIKATVEAQKELKIAPKEENRATTEEENEALRELKTKVEDFRTTLRDYSTLAGGGVSKLASSTDEAVATATASNSATSGSFTISVSQLAQNGAFSFNDRYSSATQAAAPSISNAAPLADRTISFQIGTGSNQETVKLELTNTTTITDLVNNFNSTSTKARASLVNVGTTLAPSYAFSITTLNEGTELGQITANIGAAFTTNLNSFNLNQAKNSRFSVLGISGTIERSSNTLTDVAPGVTISLQSLGSSTVTVGIDNNGTETNLKNLLDKYNSIVEFIKENDTITVEENGQNTEAIYGTLARTNIDDDLLSTLKNALSGARATNGVTVKIFAELGVTTQRDGTLTLNSETFLKAITEDPTGLEQLVTSFADANAATGGTINQFTQFKGVIDIGIDSNNEQIRDLNERIADAEAFIAGLETQLTGRFARLESLIGRLQGQQNQLSGALAGLSR